MKRKAGTANKIAVPAFHLCFARIDKSFLPIIDIIWQLT